MSHSIGKNPGLLAEAHLNIKTSMYLCICVLQDSCVAVRLVMLSIVDSILHPVRADMISVIISMYVWIVLNQSAAKKRCMVYDAVFNPGTLEMEKKVGTGRLRNDCSLPS